MVVSFAQKFWVCCTAIGPLRAWKGVKDMAMIEEERKRVSREEQAGFHERVDDTVA